MKQHFNFLLRGTNKPNHHTVCIADAGQISMRQFIEHQRFENLNVRFCDKVMGCSNRCFHTSTTRE